MNMITFSSMLPRPDILHFPWDLISNLKFRGSEFFNLRNYDNSWALLVLHLDCVELVLVLVLLLEAIRRICRSNGGCYATNLKIECAKVFPCLDPLGINYMFELCTRTGSRAGL